MNASELVEKLNGMSEVSGAEIVVNEAHQQVEVYSFHLTVDFRACKAALESLGFSCMPNSGFWQGEAEVAPFVRRELTERELYEQGEQFVANEGHLADATMEAAIRSGKSYSQWKEM